MLQCAEGFWFTQARAFMPVRGKEKEQNKTCIPIPCWSHNSFWFGFLYPLSRLNGKKFFVCHTRFHSTFVSPYTCGWKSLDFMPFCRDQGHIHAFAFHGFRLLINFSPIRFCSFYPALSSSSMRTHPPHAPTPLNKRTHPPNARTPLNIHKSLPLSPPSFPPPQLKPRSAS